jgi:streptogrisin C
MYGDWKLIQGSTYGTYVFSGDLLSNDALPITNANYGARPDGSQMCTSGRTTAQICRYFVSGSYLTHTVSGVTSNYQLRMYHDGNLDGSADRSGFEPGDSGGPCYYSDGSGGVVVNGIVKGRTIPDYPNPITYFCTQLTGVRYWDAGSYVG